MHLIIFFLFLLFLLLLTVWDSDSLRAAPRVMKGVGSFLFAASCGDAITGLGIFTVFQHAAVPGVENHSSGWGKRGGGKAHNSFECKEKPGDVT